MPERVSPQTHSHYTDGMTDSIQVAFVTCPPDAAATLARALVEQRAAACVNILPGVQSVYRWNGETAQDHEALLLIKFGTGGFDRLRAAILELHPYELPEIIAVPVNQGHAPYLDWVRSACSP